MNARGGRNNFMKKFILVLFALLLLVSCGTSTPTETDPAETDPVETGTSEGGKYKVGLASVTAANLTDASEDAAGRVQFNTTMAAVLLDEEGKVVDVRIDTAQNSVAVSAEGAATAPEATPSKAEKKEDYNMKGQSGIGKEWYEQIAALEAWMVGQTVADILAVPTEERDAGHLAVPTGDDLKSSVTITIDGYLEAFKRATEALIDVEGDVAKFGFANTTAFNITDASEDAAGSAQANTDFSVVLLDAEGKVVYVKNDVSQNRVSFDAEGAFGEFTETPSKHVRKEDYNMKGQSNIGKEWYEQANALNEWMVGQTVAEILTVPTEERDAGHPAVPTGEDLTSSVTITINSYLEVLEKAAKNAVDVK